MQVGRLVQDADGSTWMPPSRWNRRLVKGGVQGGVQGEVQGGGGHQDENECGLWQVGRQEVARQVGR